MNIKLIIVDVDGTLTDSGIYYDENGNETKKFCTKDAAGFFAAKSVGIKTMVLTGRSSAATKKRMQELKVDYLYEGVKDKKSFIQDFMRENSLCRNDILYIGDDLNDYAAMKLAGTVACPCDSCNEVRGIADYVSPISGGHGAVRDIIEKILIDNGLWARAIEDVYDCGI